MAARTEAAEDQHGGQARPRAASPTRPALGHVLPLVCVLGACLLNAVRTYDVGFNIGDEGSAILVAQQVLGGKMLYRDVHSDNNVLVPLSLVAVFGIFGVDFLVFRLFHLVLAALAAVFGYLTVVQVSGDRRLAVLAGVLIGLFPGTLHKTFIPLAVTANLYALSRLGFERAKLPKRAVIVPSATVALTIMTRTDLGWTFALILSVLLTVYVVSRTVGLRRRAYRILTYLGVQAGVIIVAAVPFFVWASASGLVAELLQKQGRQLVTVLRVIGFNSGVADPALAAFATASSTNLLLERPPLSAVLAGGTTGGLAALLYGQALILALGLALTSGVLALRMLRPGRGLSNQAARGWALWMAAGPGFASFALFRPDFQHLSQFMASGFVVILGTIGLLLRDSSSCRSARANWLAGSASAVLGLYLGVYVVLALASLSLPLSTPKTALERYTSPDGRISVLVSAAEAAFLREMVGVVQAESTPADTLLCFTYCPGLNVLAGRPTFLARRYADNATPLKEPHWQQETIAQIEAHRPRVIVLNQYAPNGTEHSRFDVWATDVVAHIRQMYERRTTISGWEVLVRRDDGRG